MVAPLSSSRGLSASDIDTSGPRSLRIGRYELVGQLAQGGMGTVYLARVAGEAGFSRLYAIKLMHEHLAGDEAFVGMFLDEARLAAGIHHANVVSVVDLGVSERGHFVVMDYVEGCTLEQLLRRQNERPPERVVPLVIDLLQGLHAAHTLRDEDGQPLDLVHRDVSPANVLIGIDGVARITDFGIAKARSRITSTRPGLHKGKLSYAAPEQLTAENPVDARTDVFAAGALLWAALTGESLFAGETEAQTVRNVLQKEIPPPSMVGLRPPACLDEVCLRALRRDPADRYDSALDMAEALREVARQHGFLSSTTRIGAWVEESFSKELTARRVMLRDVISGSRAPEGPASGISALPRIPGSMDSSVSISAVSIARDGSVSPAPSGVFSTSHRGLKGGLLLAALGCGAALAWWSVPEEKEAPPAVVETIEAEPEPIQKAEPPAAKFQVAPPETPVEEPAVEEEKEEPKAAVKKAPEPPSRPHKRRSASRGSNSHSERRAAPAPSPEPVVQPAELAKPPKPTKMDTIDQNPYMRSR